MNPQPPEAQAQREKTSVALTIGALADQTGVAVATLRMWESRHGFPRAGRLASGHRRYDEGTVEQVRQVLRLRDGGLRLESAIREVTSSPGEPIPSVFADLRQRHPGLAPHRLRKSTLLAVTWALEDECYARAESPWLFGAFQQERYYRQAERRWRDLARTARRAWALADFVEPRETTASRPVEVTIPAGSAMHREWSLVCLGGDFSAVLAAWEVPGQASVPDQDRLFESVWSVEPTAVRDAAHACARMIAELGHDAADVLEDLDRRPSPASADLRQATALFNRVVAYVDRAH